ncbi:MAG TPA: AarF/ABC1/UbiB kinase family protein [Nocardioidaceae bacterium]|nr:AarF/ABC1/UbiB kinase family protein [Nocardioidaceae bacterium]
MTELPKRTVARTARLASIPLGYAGRATLGLGRRIGGAPADAVASQVQERTAEQLFKVLGELKGGAMKLGQALSIFESALPESLVAPYRTTLTRLQDSAPPMQSGMVHQVLARELGGGWRRDLVEFDDDPAAAASIGQVHHGRWRDGREVAIKIQYPGAGDAVMSDLKTLGRAARLFAGLVPGLDIKPLIDELRARVVEELDYRLEADAQRQFAAEFLDDPLIVVPGVVTNTDTVLVTEWLESPRSLARLIADGTQQERDHFGEVYVRFLFSGPDRTGLLHADPHPGNFRLMHDGRLGVVDYGAVARLPDGALPRVIGRLLRRAVDDDYDAVLDGLREAGFVRPGITLDADKLRDYLSPFVEPAAVERFQFSREWMRGQFNRLNDPRATDFGTMLKITLPPEFLLIHRVWLGGIGVLSQLGAEAPFARILAESLPEFTPQN